MRTAPTFCKGSIFDYELLLGDYAEIDKRMYEGRVDCAIMAMAENGPGASILPNTSVTYFSIYGIFICR